MTTYGTKQGVRLRLGLKASDATQDEEIAVALTYADGWVDALFASIDQTVPSGSTPQQVIDAANDLATAWIYRITEPTKSTVYQDSGERLLAIYIERYRKGTSAKAGISD